MFEDQAVTRGKRDEAKEQKWRGVLEEQRRSKQSVRAFCRERGLKEASFYRWRQVIDRRDRRGAEATGAETLAANYLASYQPKPLHRRLLACNLKASTS